LARILSYAAVTPGHYFPFVPILLELQTRGHTVLGATFGRQPPGAEIGGIPIRGIDIGQPAPPNNDGLSPPGAWRQVLTGFVAWGEPMASGLERLIAEERPDFLLVDPALWGGVIAAEASTLPWATVAHNPLLFRGLGVDVRARGLAPPRGLLERMWYHMLWKQQREEDDRLLPAINAVRSARRLRPLAHAWDLDFLPPLVLAATAEPFEYPRGDWPPSLLFVGPLFWDPPAPHLDWHGASGVPLVLLVDSTVRDPAPSASWVNVAITALADEPLEVIATVPTDCAPTRLPVNVRVERFIPHNRVLPHASCVVCHGGFGITQRALAAGIPVVVVPFGYDRFDVARRVEVCEAGVVVPRRRLTPQSLRAAVYKAMACKAGAERIANVFRRSGGPRAAADAIEPMLRPALP
jgi:MGT family glycosyltransferase